MVVIAVPTPVMKRQLTITIWISEREKYTMMLQIPAINIVQTEKKEYNLILSSSRK